MPTLKEQVTFTIDMMRINLCIEMMRILAHLFLTLVEVDFGPFCLKINNRLLLKFFIKLRPRSSARYQGPLLMLLSIL